ncbi:hypothetical protein FE257_008775 [Aspergillus nanangensis]|uniref:Uncharacterized protein n=1 Tax=Aspergillus nanangensis TaxID=2582783 RepID=A0AAD4GT50_ASPNN|nr:hypothetical protein FE257_008775 [Aspergillus nanangensis]
MDQPPYSPRLDQLSPPCSITETPSAENIPSPSLAPPPDRNNNTFYIQERLMAIAHRLAHNTACSSDDAVTVHSHLDDIELLLDPRPALTQEITKYRPAVSAHIVGASSSPSPLSSYTPQLTGLLHEITTLNTELKQRRNESVHLYERFTHELRGSTQRVSQLETEICQLKADSVEDSAEREALQGTVQGLESWVTAWHRQHGLAVMKKLRHTRQQGSKRKPDPRNNQENEIEVLVEGMAAWMRGWKDLEEGFRLREKGRQARREERYTRNPRGILQTST